jgi:hypothetical protein
MWFMAIKQLPAQLESHLQTERRRSRQQAVDSPLFGGIVFEQYALT